RPCLPRLVARDVGTIRSQCGRARRFCPRAVQGERRVHCREEESLIQPVLPVWTFTGPNELVRWVVRGNIVELERHPRLCGPRVAGEPFGEHVKDIRGTMVKGEIWICYDVVRRDHTVD